jgi:hypothetical protein
MWRINEGWEREFWGLILIVKKFFFFGSVSIFKLRTICWKIYRERAEEERKGMIALMSLSFRKFLMNFNCHDYCAKWLKFQWRATASSPLWCYLRLREDCGSFPVPQSVCEDLLPVTGGSEYSNNGKSNRYCSM